MKELTQKPQNIVLVGDAFVSPDTDGAGGAAKRTLLR